MGAADPGRDPIQLRGGRALGQHHQLLIPIAALVDPAPFAATVTGRVAGRVVGRLAGRVGGSAVGGVGDPGERADLRIRQPAGRELRPHPRQSGQRVADA